MGQGGGSHAGRGRPVRLAMAGLQVGGQLPGDLRVYDETGKEIRLGKILQGKHTVLVNGCLTCPIFLRTFAGVEAVERDYGPKGVQLFYLYKSLAHPENTGYVQPFTLEERLKHVHEAKAWMRTEIPWLCDNMDNGVLAALGGMPNSEVFIGPDRKILYLAD